MALATSRPVDPPAFFPSWTDYLRHWTGSDDETFCRAIAAVYQNVVKGELETITRNITKASTAAPPAERELLREEFEADRDRVRTRLGFPWITPILGSGCLGLDESSFAPSIEAVPKRVAAVSRDWGYLPDGSSVASGIEQFALSLVNSKLGVGTATRAALYEPTADDGSQDETTEIAARVILCAQLLTRLYFEAGTTTANAVLNYKDAISFSTDLGGSFPRGAELRDLLVVPLAGQLRDLRSAVNARGVDIAFVSDFAGAVLRDLTDVPDRVTVTGSDATLMAEIAWHFMTEGTSQYPGWSDLLTQLTLASDSAERSHRWPHLLNLSLARSRLHSQIITTTVDSWGSRVKSFRKQNKDLVPSARDGLYDGVADLLISQAALHGASGSEGADQWPPAVAFVTSFDLELEMALMAARSPFRIVVPFYVRPSDTPDNARAFVWLQTTVEAIPTSEELTAEHLYRLRVTRDWSLLTSLSDPTKDDFSMPIVVRVAGTPLIKVDGIDTLAPDERPYAVEDELNADWIEELRVSVGGPAMTLAGTVLLDEYTALHQWAAELAQPPNVDRDNQDERLGLPIRFFKGGQETDARFWFVLGVQLSDEAVRHRTAAVVSTADLRSHSTKEPRGTARAGVVVNRRTTPNERDVFLWQGLDVVAATYEQVLPALRHMAQHTAAPNLRRFQGERCKVEEGIA